MKIITIDFETYFDDDYSLKKLTTEEYVRDPRFEAHGAAVSVNGSPAVWQCPDETRHACKIWPRPIACLAHHAHFDGLILNHHFDFRPDFWLDTLSMARVCFDSGVKHGLDDVAQRLGLGAKTMPYDLVKGKHWADMNDWERSALVEGACRDCALTWQVFEIMMTGNLGTLLNDKHPEVPYPFPPSELAVVDLTVRMFTEPCLVGDLAALGDAWSAEQDERRGLFETFDVTAKDLRQDAKFAELLSELGIDPQRKTTAKGNDKFAFAKSDRFMQDLLAGDNEYAALLAEARLKAKSSIYMTRIERYGFMARRGPLPVYLSYAAAHTRRWGGGDKTNFQNLPRPDEYRPHKGALRRAIKAP